MPRKPNSIGIRVLWFFSLVTAVFSARYFLTPPPLLSPDVGIPALRDVLKGPVLEALRVAAPYLYNHHRMLFLTHVACGIVALVLGLFQFIGSLRASRPQLHRMMGRIYIVCVLAGGATGVPLSFLMFKPMPVGIHALFYPMQAGLLSLSIVWPITALIAFRRVLQRRFTDHRAWMMRCYSLTFAAPTSRTLGPVLFLLTGDLVLALNITFVSWPLNLLVAEWLVRRSEKRTASAALPDVATATVQS
jgi:uncharacterized membrane protein